MTCWVDGKFHDLSDIDGPLPTDSKEWTHIWFSNGEFIDINHVKNRRKFLLRKPWWQRFWMWLVERG